MNELTTQAAPSVPAEATYIPPPMLHPDRFGYLWRFAEIMAETSTVPASLRTTGSANNLKDLPRETVIANCFLVCEQADRWGVSPFALLTTAFIVHGKLGFEGKAIHAILQGVYKIHPRYTYEGDPGTDGRRITVTATGPDGIEKSISGTVKQWKTSGNGSPWRQDDYDKMLGYRGVREWAREHYPAAIMGIVGDDEIGAIAEEARMMQARDITSVSDRLKGAGGAGGFNPDKVTAEIGHGGQAPMDFTTEAEKEAVERGAAAAEKKADAQKAQKSAEEEEQKPVDEKSAAGTKIESQGQTPPITVRITDRMKRADSYEDYAAVREEYRPILKDESDEVRAACNKIMEVHRERLKKANKFHPPSEGGDL